MKPFKDETEMKDRMPGGNFFRVKDGWEVKKGSKRGIITKSSLQNKQ